VAFSPNSKILYYSNIKNLFQLNLDTTDILASKRHVATYDGFFDPSTGSSYFKTYFGYSWLAPNNKIYMCTARGTKYFHTIEFPDSLGTACNFQQHNVYYNCYNAYTTPNHYNYFLGAESGTICDSLGLSVSSPVIANTTLKEGRFGPNPNPANEGFYFNYHIPQHTTLQISNSSGAIVHTQTLYSWFGYVQIDCSSWANGVYNYKAGDKTGKIVVLHE
jgi:hypothetical protein